MGARKEIVAGAEITLVIDETGVVIEAGADLGTGRGGVRLIGPCLETEKIPVIGVAGVEIGKKPAGAEVDLRICYFNGS